MKISEFFFFLSENFQFLEVKFSIYLNRHVFVMKWLLMCTCNLCLYVCVCFFVWLVFLFYFLFGS